MGRVFTINFRFREEPVTALVNLNTVGYDISVNVRYLNKQIASLVPGGKVEFSLAEGLKNKDLDGRLAEELVYQTSEIISDYLEKH
jgi:hypothetical protein